MPCRYQLALTHSRWLASPRGPRCLRGGLAVDRDDVRLLQVKTLGPSRPDPGYRQTRRCYQAMGLAPLEEITGLWPENPCLLMVKVLGAGGAR